jgi:hypothetical protein
MLVFIRFDDGNVKLKLVTDDLLGHANGNLPDPAYAVISKPSAALREGKIQRHADTSPDDPAFKRQGGILEVRFVYEGGLVQRSRRCHDISRNLSVTLHTAHISRFFISWCGFTKLSISM